MANAANHSASGEGRFRPRFSLQALLAVTTILCIVLGWRVNRAHQQRQAVEAIRAAGGVVHYDYQQSEELKPGDFDTFNQPWEPEWLLDPLGIDFFHDVIDVDMAYRQSGNDPNDKPPTSSIAAQLVHFPKLKSLTARGVEIGDADMPIVSRLLALESLSLCDNPEITDDGIRFLGGLWRLRSLFLNRTCIGDCGLAVLARLPNLEELVIQNSLPTDDGLAITDDGLAVLAGHPSLRRLHLCDCRVCEISDAGVVHLAQIPRLEELGLVQTRVTPLGLKPMQKVKSLSKVGLFGSAPGDYGVVERLFPNCQVDAGDLLSDGRMK